MPDHQKDASEVHSFMGLVQYSVKFMPDIATVAKPIQELTKKGIAFQWGVEQQTAFQELKRLITQADTLAYYKVGCKTRIVVDVSPVGLGAVLTQQQGETWRVISYAKNRSLRAHLFAYAKALCTNRKMGVDFRVVYRPGNTNIADSLSRLNSVNQLDR